MNSKKALAIAGTGESVVPNETQAQWLEKNAAEFDQRLENVKRSGLAAYAKENLSAYYKGNLKSSEIRPRIGRLAGWIAENPRLLAEFENDWRKGNIVFSQGGRFAPLGKGGQFNSMLGLWLGTKHVAAEYKESPKQKVPKPVEAAARGEESRKAGNLAICAERPGGGLGPAAMILLSTNKDARRAANTLPGINANLAFVAYPWLKGYGGIARQDPAQGEFTLRELHERMKKTNFDTEFFAQYLMRINSITTPEVKDKISNIFLRLGAIVRDNPRLAFSDFIGDFVVEMNREFGENMVIGIPKRPMRKQGKKPTKMEAYVPKRTSGGSGKPPPA